jgi:sugar lactone lactonase YvrE
MNLSANPPRLSFFKPSLLTGVLAVLSVFPMMVSAGVIDFNSDHWDLKDAEIKDYLGRKALTGSAFLKDVVFENGVIEVDLAMDHKQSYPAIIFRRQSEGDYEHVYFRPHRAGHYPDALQYAPAFNGVAGWQLYNGAGFTAGLSLPANQWIHVRLEVMGTQARVFVGESNQPALVINDLKRGRSKGALGLAGPRDGTAHFSNFSYTPSDNLHFDPPATVEPACGIVTDWSISQPLQAFDIGIERYPDEQALKAMQWVQVKSEPSGLVDIARYRKPFANGTSKILARTTIQAGEKEIRPFAFGYSDDISIYLNGQIIFQGNSGYKRRDPSFLGIIGWNDTVYLPLEKGANELMFVVSEVFGGWGFMCRDMNAIYQHKSLAKVWELPGQLHAPESVAYDAKRNVLYVSNFGDEFISKIGLNGEIIALKWATGLKNPTGLMFFNERLYAVERPGVAEIDPETGRITNRYPVPGALFLNDLSFDNRGAIYVTDSFKNCVFKLSGGKSEVWIEGKAVEDPNGILVEKERLLVGVTADGTIKSVDLKTKQVSTFLTLGPGANMDGLVGDGKGGYLFSDYFGRIYRADAEGRKTLLLDRRGPRQFCSDFEYIPEQHLLVVPSLYDNRLTAYQYKPDAL